MDDYLQKLQESAVELRRQKWTLRPWKKRPVLASLEGRNSVLYTGQPYDAKRYTVIPDGWNHDHCELCWQTISDFTDENTIDTAYTDGSKWVCPGCFQGVIVDGNAPTA